MTWYQGSLGSFPMKLLQAESGPDAGQIKICPPPKLISQVCVSAESELLQELPVGDKLVSRRSWGLSSSWLVTACLKCCKIKSIFRGQKYLIKGKNKCDISESGCDAGLWKMMNRCHQVIRRLINVSSSFKAEQHQTFMDFQAARGEKLVPQTNISCNISLLIELVCILWGGSCVTTETGFCIFFR